MRRFDFLAAVLLAATCATLTACSSDDDEPGGGTEQTTGRKLKKVYETVMDGTDDHTYCLFDSPEWKDGKVVAHTQRGTDFFKISYLGNNKALITTYDDDAGTIVLLNNDGYATQLGDDEDPYTFTYNADGQMTKWGCGHQSNTLTYDSNGDLVRTSPSRNGTAHRFTYTNSTVTTPIENKGGIMLLREWDIIWSLEYYFEDYWYFGIYGKASKHLPVQVGSNTYAWTLDSQGYPTKCVATHKGGYVSTFYFEWE